MTPERWQRVKDLFHAAADRPTDERAAFLEGACASDHEVRVQVESLLAHDRSTRGHSVSGHGVAALIADERAQLIDAALSEHRLEPGHLVGPYRVIELLGAGGMGEIYKATDTRLGRTVALKLISASALGPSHIERLIGEARAASALNHPNICTVYDIADFRGEPLLVMEMLEGQTLDAELAATPLPIGRWLDLAIQIASGLEAAHLAGIIHRDIKPANIFVTSRGPAKILDFGLAKTAPTDQSAANSLLWLPSRATQRHTEPGSNPGTPGYMSPEQARGEELDARSDLFSLGLVLRDMAIGKTRLEGGLRSGRHIPRAVGGILQRALAADRQQRYQTASAILDDLHRIVRKRARRPAYAALLLLSIAALGAIVVLRLQRGTLPHHAEWMQITNFSDAAVEPALSPDGAMLTFIRGPRTFTTLGQVYVMRLPAGEPRQLTHDDRMKMSPVFSPDGSSIAYTRIDENWAWDTWRVPVAGGSAAPFLANASGLSWIGQGKHLFSALRAGSHMSIVTSDEGRQGVRTVYNPPRSIGMAHRAYLSPDRGSVLLAEMEAARWLPCRLVPFDGSTHGRTVGPSGASCTSAAWSPDGRWMYFSSNARGAFHIWRQEFPDGTPQQITSGPAEEEGIAMAADGRSLITSVGTAVSTVWIRDRRGERALSEQGHSFRPRFSPDGTTVFYLVSQRAGAYHASAGELWSVDVATSRRRRLALSNAIVNYELESTGREIVFVTVDQSPGATLWRAPTDARTPPQKLADDVGSVIAATKEGIVFAAMEGSKAVIYAVRADGRDRRKALPEPVTRLRGVSPDGRWLVVQDGIAMGSDPAPVVLYPFGGTPASRLPLCSACSVRWVLGGQYLSLRFSGVSDAEQRPTYLVPLLPGELLPTVFRQRRLVSETDIATAPGVRIVPGDVTFGADAHTYVYPKFTSHRNLFRIPLE